MRKSHNGPQFPGMPAHRRARVIDERIQMFAATRVRPDRVRGRLNSIASRPLWEFYEVLRGSTGFYWVLLGSPGFYWVLLGSLGSLEDRRSGFGRIVTSPPSSIQPRLTSASHQAFEMAAAWSGPLHCCDITTS